MAGAFLAAFRAAIGLHAGECLLIIEWWNETKGSEAALEEENGDQERIRMFRM